MNSAENTNKNLQLATEVSKLSPVGQIQPAACFYTTQELKNVFYIFQSLKVINQNKKTILWEPYEIQIPVSINKGCLLLCCCLEHCHHHSFMYCLWLWAELSICDNSFGLQSQKFTTWPLTEKAWQTQLYQSLWKDLLL